MNWQKWMRQSLPRTDYMRGGATVWPKGGSGLIGDSLGPVMHLHDGASEIFYFISGSCRLEVGNTQELYGRGDFVLVPPEVPHNVLNAADEDLLVFWIVAPHFQHNKWRTRDFPAGAMERRAMHGQVHNGTELPSDAQIHSQQMRLAEGMIHSRRTGELQEAVLYVVDGNAQVTVGKLTGTLAVHDFVHVPVDTAYALAPAAGAASVLLFEMPGT
jgi:quercetin dioxygenase-like cupin family protein